MRNLGKIGAAGEGASPEGEVYLENGNGNGQRRLL
jgi:hypothetical protein